MSLHLLPDGRLTPSKKYHYRFCPAGREILVIGDDIYEAPLENDFDPDGIRYECKRIMTKTQWDEIEQWGIERGTYIISDTVIVYLNLPNGGWNV